MPRFHEFVDGVARALFALGSASTADSTRGFRSLHPSLPDDDVARFAAEISANRARRFVDSALALARPLTEDNPMIAVSDRTALDRLRADRGKPAVVAYIHLGAFWLVPLFLAEATGRSVASMGLADANVAMRGIIRTRDKATRSRLRFIDVPSPGSMVAAARAVRANSIVCLTVDGPLLMRSFRPCDVTGGYLFDFRPVLALTRAGHADRYVAWTRAAPDFRAYIEVCHLTSDDAEQQMRRILSETIGCASHESIQYSIIGSLLKARSDERV
jgi:hypothetical protein